MLIPLSLVGPTTAVVLCGDPRQLGGAVRSGVARAAGLGLSLQERLMACMGSQQHDTSRSKGGSGSDSNTSNSGGGSGGTGSSTSSNGEGVGKASTSTGSTWHSSRWIAMLSANYRSHAALLDVPSQLFYSGQLEEHADPSLTHSLLKWEGLPGQHPMLFYGVRGREEAEIDSPSYFNLIEAEMVRACAFISFVYLSSVLCHICSLWLRFSLILVIFATSLRLILVSYGHAVFTRVFFSEIKHTQTSTHLPTPSTVLPYTTGSRPRQAVAAFLQGSGVHLGHWHCGGFSSAGAAAAAAPARPGIRECECRPSRRLSGQRA